LEVSPKEDLRLELPIFKQKNGGDDGNSMGQRKTFCLKGARIGRQSFPID
jgi:hypothetical protein